MKRGEDEVLNKIVPLLLRRRVVYKQLLSCIHACLLYTLDCVRLTPDDRQRVLFYDEGLQVLIHAV